MTEISQDTARRMAAELEAVKATCEACGVARWVGRPAIDMVRVVAMAASPNVLIPEHIAEVATTFGFTESEVAGEPVIGGPPLAYAPDGQCLGIVMGEPEKLPFGARRPTGSYGARTPTRTDFGRIGIYEPGGSADADYAATVGALEAIGDAGAAAAAAAAAMATAIAEWGNAEADGRCGSDECNAMLAALADYNRAIGAPLPTHVRRRRYVVVDSVLVAETYESLAEKCHMVGVFALGGAVVAVHPEVLGQLRAASLAASGPFPEMDTDGDYRRHDMECSDYGRLCDELAQAVLEQVKP